MSAVPSGARRARTLTRTGDPAMFGPAAVLGTVGADRFNPQAGGVFSVPIPIFASACAILLGACFAV